MKKIITLFLLTGSIYACNSGNSDAKTDTTTSNVTASTDVTSTPEFTKGLDLVKNSDCATCHKVDEKVMGPAFREIANKYPNNDATIDTLAHKIMSGGSGNWGNIPMVAHPGISVEDAKAMAKYVLLLKNN